MASMFYSLKETAQKLGTTEDQVKLLVRDGRLREFRDGSNLLFKIDEVEGLVAENIDMNLDAVDLEDMELSEASADEPAAEALEEAAPMLDDDDLFKLDGEEAPALEPMGEVESTSELGLAPEETATDETSGGTEELLFLSDEEQPAAEDTGEVLADTGEMGLANATETDATETGAAEPDLADSLETGLADSSEEEISLASESGVLAEGSSISDMDTALTGEGVNVLGESSTDFNVTEDSMAETAVGPAGSSAEASLEEIEDDVNLDSFGSGSGLLDLSLQADDTSLGGILDEIYTSEGGEAAEGSGSGAGADTEPAEIGEEGASFDDITAEVERPAGEEELPMPEPVAVMPAAIGAAYVEAAPDAQSNILGMLLFLPMLALLYTAIVAVAGLRGVTPGILSSIQSMVWYILGAGIVVTLIVTGVSFMAGRERSEATVRVRKEKKVKEKPKKEKKAKEKPAKAEKPAKEKKSFFGKKK